MSKVAGVVIDDWKLPIFLRHLDAAGFTYEDPVPFMPGTLTLRVHFQWVSKLQPIIEDAERECAEERKNNK
jgi:hypothetical protein